MGVIRIKDKDGKITEIPSFKGDPGEISLAYGHKNFANAIENSVSGNSVVLNDSAAAPLRALKIYGKSTQNATPAPDAPIDIVSVGDDGDVNIGLYNNNLAENFYICEEVLQFSEALFIETTLAPSTKYTLSFKGTVGNVYYINEHVFVTKDIKIKDGVTTITLITKNVLNKASTSQYQSGRGWLVLKNRENNTEHIFDNLMLNYGDVAKDYETYKTKHSITLTTSLRAIPVTDKTLATYTDANGQMWYADEIDLEKGVYVQRVGSSVGKTWVASNIDASCNGERYYLLCEDRKAERYCNVLCTNYQQINYATFSSNGDFISTDETNKINVRCTEKVFGGASAFNEWVTNVGMVVYYPLKTPIVTSLTAKKIAEYQALRTNYPNTTILNDENAFMDVAYVADTKLYIDNKIAALG